MGDNDISCRFTDANGKSKNIPYRTNGLARRNFAWNDNLLGWSSVYEKIFAKDLSVYPQAVLAEKISIEWRKKIKRKEEDDFFGVFPKKKQKQVAYAANEEDSEENLGTNEISVFRTFEISADNTPPGMKKY